MQIITCTSSETVLSTASQLVKAGQRVECVVVSPSVLEEDKVRGCHMP